MQDFHCGAGGKGSPLEVEVFARFLFEERGCLRTDGYMKHLLDHVVKTVRVFYLRDGVYTFGNPHGVHPSILDKCFARYCAWVKLAVATIHSEFPSFELLNSFEILNLSKSKKNATRNADPDHMKKHARTLAKGFFPSRWHPYPIGPWILLAGAAC